MRKPVFGISDQVRHKPDCTVPLKMVIGLKYPIWDEEELYNLSSLIVRVCSENKGADQLHVYREADLRLCFSHMQEADLCSHDKAHFIYNIGYRTDIGGYCPEFGYRRTRACERP